MKQSFKIFLYNFLVIYFIHLFLFSTNEVYANTYKIENIKITDQYNENFNKDAVIDKAFTRGFQILINKITISKDHKFLKKQNLKLIKSFVDSFSVVNEKFKNNMYHGTFEIYFNKKKILSFLRNENIFHSKMSEKDVLFIPIFISFEDESLLLFNENPFYKNWNSKQKDNFLLNYILQSEDLDDYKIIKDRVSFIENYDFYEIISKYELNENFIIFIVFKDDDTFKTYSKFNVNKVKSNFKSEFEKFNLNDDSKIKKMIQIMKIKYDDEWKKINLINSSIKLNINLNLKSTNIAFIEKVEKLLNEIELIEKYYISFFDNNVTRYSILSNSTPDKLIKEFEKFNLKITIKDNIWILNE